MTDFASCPPNSSISQSFGLSLTKQSSSSFIDKKQNSSIQVSSPSCQLTPTETMVNSNTESPMSSCKSIPDEYLVYEETQINPNNNGIQEQLEVNSSISDIADEEQTVWNGETPKQTELSSRRETIGSETILDDFEVEQLVQKIVPAKEFKIKTKYTAFSVIIEAEECQELSPSNKVPLQSNEKEGLSIYQAYKPLFRENKKTKKKLKKCLSIQSEKTEDSITLRKVKTNIRSPSPKITTIPIDVNKRLSYLSDTKNSQKTQSSKQIQTFSSLIPKKQTSFTNIKAKISTKENGYINSLKLANNELKRNFEFERRKHTLLLEKQPSLNTTPNKASRSTSFIFSAGNSKSPTCKGKVKQQTEVPKINIKKLNTQEQTSKIPLHFSKSVIGRSSSSHDLKMDKFTRLR